MAPSLARRLTLTALIIYGIGDILGAGIYALVGKVIEISGDQAWLTFLLSAALAVITGLSYAELASRFPVAAGAAAFVKRAFPGRLMATVAGVFVLGTGLSSAATVTTAFSGYLKEVVAIPAAVAQVTLVSLLSFLNFWGIRESSRVNMVLTAVEATGLLLAIAAGIISLDAVSLDAFLAGVGKGWSSSIFYGITIAFFAYIGFEDLCNLAEEAHQPSRDVPRAILVAIGISTAFYLLVILALQINIPKELIAQSPTPLLLLLEKAQFTAVLNAFAFIAMMAIANTGLINLIMASRLMYGMANEGLLPTALGTVHAQRQTPWVGILIAYALVLMLIFTGGLKLLAQMTSLLVITVFLLVHVSLLRIKWLAPKRHGMRVHGAFPCLGALGCAGMMTFYPPEVFLRIGVLLAAGLAIWFVQRRS